MMTFIFISPKFGDKLSPNIVTVTICYGFAAFKFVAMLLPMNFSVTNFDDKHPFLTKSLGGLFSTSVNKCDYMYSNHSTKYVPGANTLHVVQMFCPCHGAPVCKI